MHHKKSHKRKHHRRKVGALGLGSKGTGLKLLAIAGGYLLADSINAQIDKMLPTTADPTSGVQMVSKNTQTMAMVGEIGIGGLLLLRKGGGGGTMGKVMTLGGGVLAGAGLKRALKAAGVIKGYQSVPVIGRHHRMSGYQSVPVIGGNVVPPQLAGRSPAQLQGYKVNGYTPHGSGMGVLAGADCGSGISNSGSGYMN